MWPQVQTKTDTASGTVQHFIDFSLAWLDDRNYTLTVDADMAAWARAMSNAPAISVVNPTFDPRYSPLSPDNSFWLDIRVGSQTVAMMAARLFVTDDYLELKRSTRLWYDPPRPGTRRMAITVPPDTPTICGNVGHEGGLWVHPVHRKRGLSVILPHLIRALGHRQWNLDWQTGATMRGIGECGIAKWSYGAPHVVSCYEGHFVVTQRPDRLFLVYMSRDELMAGLDLDRVTGLLADRHKQPVHRPGFVQKG